MKVDRHNDTVQELEDYLMSELQGITQSLNVKLSTSTVSTSQGDTFKRITIDYEISS